MIFPAKHVHGSTFNVSRSKCLISDRIALPETTHRPICRSKSYKPQSRVVAECSNVYDSSSASLSPTKTSAPIYVAKRASPCFVRSP